jgi:uncharacterized protein YqgV (UPF0045/DUF77 family)
MIGDEHVLAEISVEPVTSGDDHHAIVHESVQALRGPGVVVTVGAMSVAIEGLLADVLAAIARAHRHAEARAIRVVTSVRLESQRGGLHLQERRDELTGAHPLLRR